jgi:hypothetical protein
VISWLLCWPAKLLTGQFWRCFMIGSQSNKGDFFPELFFCAFKSVLHNSTDVWMKLKKIYCWSSLLWTKQ